MRTVLGRAMRPMAGILLGCSACFVLPGAAGGQEADSASTASLETVAEFDGPMPTGVTVSRQGRVFVNFPRWGDDVQFTVAELKNGKAVAYPSQEMNTTPTAERQAEGFVSVQSVVVDPADRLWALDTGSIDFGPTSPGGPKLVAFDLSRDEITTKILIPPDVALEKTYLNDIRFDLRKGKEGMAFITDSGTGALIVVDLATGRSWRRLADHPSTQADKDFVAVVEGEKLLVKPSPEAQPKPLQIHADGIAITPDRLHYTPLSSRKQYSVPLDQLAGPAATDEQLAKAVREEPVKPGASDGLESDAAGNLYLTDYEHHQVLRRDENGKDVPVAVLPEIAWPDTLSLTDDGWLYIMTNQLHRMARFNKGKDQRRLPYVLYRVRVGAGPVQLGKGETAQLRR